VVWYSGNRLNHYLRLMAFCLQVNSSTLLYSILGFFFAIAVLHIGLHISLL
jgi:hypothetical protein